MVPSAKHKLSMYIQQHEGTLEFNPHGLNSPPRQVIANAAGAVSASSPLGPKHDRKMLESMRMSMKSAKPLRLGNGTMKPPGTPQIKQSASQRQDGLDGPLGYESEPPASLKSQSLHDEDGGELRERWEEQSNVHSLFSESDPMRPTSIHRDEDDDDTQSDILVNRARPRQGRQGHKSSESAPYIGRNRIQHKISDGISPLVVRNGRLEPNTADTKGFSTSMITHAPRNTVPGHAVYREDPFATTSTETSPQPQPGRRAPFLHSSFPYRESETAKGLTHIERAAFHLGAAQKLAPEKYNDETDAIHPQAFVKPDRYHSISDQRPTTFPNIEDAPLTDSDADESDVPSQGDELEQHQRTPQGSKSRAVPENATVVFNPQKPILPQKPHKTVVMQEPVLQVSPMSRFIGQQSPSNKRRRDIDYDDAALQEMDFAELQNEPFDHDPTRQDPQSPAKPPADNLGDRLKFYSSKGEEAQTQFFTQMPVRDWEDSGDWFLEQFGDVVKKMKEARQAKRKLVEQYESEISNREDAVRRKKESIDHKLSELKQDGDAMLKGKELDI